MTTRRTALALPLALASPGVARAQTPRRMRMATSWPRTLPGPAQSALRIARRIGALTQGRLEVQVFTAGEIVPAFGVQDAVSAGTIEMGHTAAFFGIGREPALAAFTTLPFGMTPVEHMAWLTQGGGQSLWDETQAAYGLKPFVGGNTGLSMGGWFRREIGSVEDLRGLKIRMVGLGGELFQRLGATALAIPPADIYSALERGTIDAAEFTSPGADLQLSLWRAAPFYYAPGFNKPNGASEFVINRTVWDRLDADLKLAIEAACEAEHTTALAEMERLNMDALRTMIGDHGVRLRGFPVDVLRRARTEAEALKREIGTRSALAGRVIESATAFQARLSPWSRLSTQAMLAARDV